MPRRKYQELFVLSDREAEDLLASWTAETQAWARRHGLPEPFTPELVHDLALMTTAFSSAWVLGHMTKEYERRKPGGRQ